MNSERRNPNAGKIFVEDPITGGWNERHPDGTTTPADGPFSQGVDPIANLPNLAAKQVDAETTAEEEHDEANKERSQAMLMQLQYVVYLEAYMAGYKEAYGLETFDPTQQEAVLGLAQKAWNDRVKMMQRAQDEHDAAS